MNMFIRLAVRAPFLAIGSIVMAFTISCADRALVFLVSTPLIVLVLYARYAQQRCPMYGAISSAGQDGIARLAGEHLEGARVIRAFGRQAGQRGEQAFDAGGRHAGRRHRARGQAHQRRAEPHHFGYRKPCHCGHRLVRGPGLRNTGRHASRARSSRMVNYMTQTLLALIVLANIIVILTKALASAKRVSEVLAQERSDMAAEPQAEAPRSSPEGVRRRIGV